jgi:hypothetical protein
MGRRVRLIDPYVYVSLTSKSTERERKLMEQRIGKLRVPVEYSLSPSGCVCYRMLKKYLVPWSGLPGTKIDRWNDIPYALPGGQEDLTENNAIREFHMENTLAFLYKEWNEVPRVKAEDRGRRLRSARVGRRKPRKINN